MRYFTSDNCFAASLEMTSMLHVEALYNLVVTNQVENHEVFNAIMTLEQAMTFLSEFTENVQLEDNLWGIDIGGG